MRSYPLHYFPYPPLAGAQAPDGELALSEAIKLARDNHPALRAASHGVAAAAAGIEVARAGFLPRVDFSEGVTQSNNPVFAFGSLLSRMAVPVLYYMSERRRAARTHAATGPEGQGEPGSRLDPQAG